MTEWLDWAVRILKNPPVSFYSRLLKGSFRGSNDDFRKPREFTEISEVDFPKHHKKVSETSSELFWRLDFLEFSVKIVMRRWLKLGSKITIWLLCVFFQDEAELLGGVFLKDSPRNLFRRIFTHFDLSAYFAIGWKFNHHLDVLLCKRGRFWAPPILVSFPKMWKQSCFSFPQAHMLPTPDFPHTPRYWVKSPWKSDESFLFDNKVTVTPWDWPQVLGIFIIPQKIA